MNRHPAPRSILVLDNVSFHHSDFVEYEANRLGIEIVYLPPYFPNGNLSELFGNGIKQKLISEQVFGKRQMIDGIRRSHYSLRRDWSSCIWKMGYEC